jgi:hypothetical protein
LEYINGIIMVISNNSNAKPSITILHLDAEPNNNKEYEQVLCVCQDLDSSLSKYCFDINSIQGELPSIINDNTVIILWLDFNLIAEWTKLKPVINSILKLINPTDILYEDVLSHDIGAYISSDELVSTTTGVDSSTKDKSKFHLNSRLIVFSRNYVDNDSNVNLFYNQQNYNFNTSYNLKSTLHRKINLLEWPIDSLDITVNITSVFIKINHKILLNEFKTNLDRANKIIDMSKIALETLKQHPKIGYHRATISLIDQKNQRKLLYHDDGNGIYRTAPLDYNQLQKPIGREENQDHFMATVCEHEVYIIPDVLELKSSQQGTKWLQSIGWEDNVEATKDIISWLGFTAKDKDDLTAVFTLEYVKPKSPTEDQKCLTHYEINSDLIEYLKVFGEIFAYRINAYIRKRNEDTLKDIMRDAGDNLSLIEFIDVIIKNI